MCLDALRERFPQLSRELLFGADDPSIQRHVWVLPTDAETASTGTLADCLRRMGMAVDELDFDDVDSDSSESASEAEHGSESGAEGSDDSAEDNCPYVESWDAGLRCPYVEPYWD